MKNQLIENPLNYTWWQLRDMAAQQQPLMAVKMEVERRELVNLTMTDCTRRELTIRGTRYIIYSMHNIEYFGENGALAMMNKPDFIRSLTRDQYADIALLSTSSYTAYEYQEALNRLAETYH